MHAEKEFMAAYIFCILSNNQLFFATYVRKIIIKSQASRPFVCQLPNSSIVSQFLSFFVFNLVLFSEDVFKQHVINQNDFFFYKIEMTHQKSFVTLVFMNKKSNKYNYKITSEGCCI